MKDERYAVFLDIDSTFYCDGKIPERNITALRLAREKGHLIFLNTARAWGIIPPFLYDSVPFDGAVCGIGTDLRLHGEQIYHHFLPHSEVKKIAEILFDGDREICLEGETTGIWIRPSERRIADTVLSSLDMLDGEYSDLKISKIYASGGLTDDEKKIFSEKYKIYCHESYDEFCPKGFSKSGGMMRMLDYIGIDRSHSIAMGDSSNDTDMLLSAGISVAMGDGIDEVKKIADYVSCNAADGGVGEAIEKFLL